MSTLKELEYAQVSPRLLEILRRQGLARLTEFQSNAIAADLMRGKSQILVTYDYGEAYQIAEIALLNRVSSDFRTRAIVLCPNPHQAERAHYSLGQKCRKLGIDVTLITRRSIATRESLKTGRVTIATYRSLDIALRTNPDIVEGVEFVLIDRLDLIGQPRLGGRLESVLVALMGEDRAVQYTAICPPVADIEDLGIWLGAQIIEDKKADVKRIFSVKAFDTASESLTELTEFVHYRRGQVMILCGNNESAESLAFQLAGLSETKESTSLDLRLSPEHRDDLRDLSREIVKFYPDCEQTKLLARLVLRGIAFFHEGVSKSQRRQLSDAWEKELLPVIVMPTRFTIASGFRATVVLLIGVFMQEFGEELSGEDGVTMLSEWQLCEVLHSAGRRGLDNEGFGIVVVDKESERERVLAKYFSQDTDRNIRPRLSEVDSVMDNPDNIQDLVLGRLCGGSEENQDPFSIVNRTFWASAHRVVDVSKENAGKVDESLVDSYISMRTTKSTENRAEEIPDESVRLVSVSPVKIEGLVRSGSREIWHYVSLKSTDGVACSCESWKYQGIRRHRLCKHLVKFARYSLRDKKTRQYAAGVVTQSLRSLELLGDLESEGLIRRAGKEVFCTDLGRDVTYLGVPVRDARSIIKEIESGKGDLKAVLLRATAARSGIPKSLISRVLERLPTKSMNVLIGHRDDLPGIVENCLEEIDYVIAIILKLTENKRHGQIRREAQDLGRNLAMLIESSR
ncbi:MAG: hypothetical protein EAX81_06320 [Candidatus Thorarchaeota archaeon]|nr:hypothetical protein [Candidatus Thorarchaeota archaeon]